MIHTGSWPVPPVFKLIQSKGQIEPEEMYRVFNMGIGMIAIVKPKNVQKVQQAIPEKTYIIGELTKGHGKTVLINQR